MKKEIITTLLCSLISFSLLSVSIEYSNFAHKNQRPYQEDTFSYYTLKNEYFFGIYDGHGGDKTSSYLKDNLFYSFFENRKKTIQQTFEFAFSKADEYAQNTFDDGSTAITVFIDSNNVLHCAWVGDSRAVVENNGNVQFATLDHKPSRPDEQMRIEKAGGHVYHHGVKRVNDLAISRSIGDKSSKKKGEGQIIAIPEYSQLQLTENNHFMILASDGLWDTVNNEQAITFVTKQLKRKTPLKSICQLLCNQAIKRGSKDNITVCIVIFNQSYKKNILEFEEKNSPQKPSLFKKIWNWLQEKFA